MPVRRIHASMVPYARRMVLVVITVNVLLGSVASDANHRTRVPINLARTAVFASARVEVHTHVNVVLVSKDRTANRVRPLTESVSTLNVFLRASRHLWREESVYLWYLSK